MRLILNPEILEVTPAYVFRALTNWVMDNIFSDSILTVENWLEVSFHLCKQRWDSSVDWLENQPMSKIHLMMNIVKKYGEQQEAEMKKSARRK
jgi:hypothetical protein